MTDKPHELAIAAARQTFGADADLSKPGIRHWIEGFIDGLTYRPAREDQNADRPRNLAA